MCLTKKIVISFLYWHLILLSANVFAEQNYRIYADENVEFSYPKDRYAGVKADAPNDHFYSFLLHLKDADADDVVTVCKGRLRKCASNDGVRPYWYSEDGTLVLFSATTTVRKRKSARLGEILYEAFPACPATDDEGPSAYAGDCYELVSSTKDRTVSVIYWIGPTSRHRSNSQAIRTAMDILKSVKVK